MKYDITQRLLWTALMLVWTAPTVLAETNLPDGTPIAACVDTKTMGCVPGGSFIRGSDSRKDNEKPQATIWLQTVYMDQYEVTVEQYQACVKAKQCKKARTRYRDYSRPKQPKVGVRWYDAVDYCRALGKHLPTEAEWEKAARGTDGRAYPWGETRATCKEAVIKDSRGRSCGVKKIAGGKPAKGRTFVVGTRAPTQFGLYDMAGNSWEWVADWSSKSYKSCGKACEGTNPKGPCDGKEPCKGHRTKIVRGGSWYWPASYATTTYRRRHVPSNDPYHHFGFRCAASPEEANAIRTKGLPSWAITASTAP